MPTRLLLEGDNLESLLARVRDEYGPGAQIVSAERLRTGGVAGFFAKERYELTVELDGPGDAPTGAPAGGGAPTDATRAGTAPATPQGRSGRLGWTGRSAARAASGDRGRSSGGQAVTVTAAPAGTATAAPGTATAAPGGGAATPATGIGRVGGRAATGTVHAPAPSAPGATAKAPAPPTATPRTGAGPRTTAGTRAPLGVPAETPTPAPTAGAGRPSASRQAARQGGWAPMTLPDPQPGWGASIRPDQQARHAAPASLEDLAAIADSADAVASFAQILSTVRGTPTQAAPAPAAPIAAAPTPATPTAAAPTPAAPTAAPPASARPAPTASARPTPTASARPAPPAPAEAAPPAFAAPITAAHSARIAGTPTGFPITPASATALAVTSPAVAAPAADPAMAGPVPVSAARAGASAPLLYASALGSLSGRDRDRSGQPAAPSLAAPPQLPARLARLVHADPAADPDRASDPDPVADQAPEPLPPTVRPIRPAPAASYPTPAYPFTAPATPAAPATSWGSRPARSDAGDGDRRPAPTWAGDQGQDGDGARRVARSADQDAAPQRTRRAAKHRLPEPASPEEPTTATTSPRQLTAPAASTQQLVASAAAPQPAPMAASQQQPAPASQQQPAPVSQQQPAPASPHEPAPEATSAQQFVASAAAPQEPAPLADRLVALGVPAWLATRATSADSYTAIAGTLSDLPAAPAAPAGPGDVLVILGDVAGAVAVARTVLTALRLDTDVLAVAGPNTVALPGSCRLTGQTDAGRWAARLRMGDTPGVVVVEADLDTRTAGWVRSIVTAVGATAVWAVVDATRKTADCARWLEALGAVDALAVHSTSGTADPASVLALGLPVAMLDGHPATPHAWAALLCRRLAESSDAAR